MLLPVVGASRLVRSSRSRRPAATDHRVGHPAAGERGTTLRVVRSFAATLLTPRPAIVPSSDSPKMLCGRTPGAIAAGPALGIASAAGLTAGVAVAAHVWGTDKLPAKVARPITAETADPPRRPAAGGAMGPPYPATNGPMF